MACQRSVAQRRSVPKGSARPREPLGHIAVDDLLRTCERVRTGWFRKAAIGRHSDSVPENGHPVKELRRGSSSAGLTSSYRRVRLLA